MLSKAGQGLPALATSAHTSEMLTALLDFIEQATFGQVSTLLCFIYYIKPYLGYAWSLAARSTRMKQTTVIRVWDKSPL